MSHVENPKPREDEIDVFGLTDIGKVRKTNEDQFLLCSLCKQMTIHSTSLPHPERLPQRGEWLAFLGLVADGVGGLEAGEEASRLAVETVVAYVSRSMHCYYTHDATQEEAFLGQLRESVLAGHASVLAQAAGKPMATTLTLCMAVWPQAYVVQVGDSRCYHLHDGTLHQITRDQTLKQQLLDEGRDAEAARYGHVLTSAIGGPKALPVVSRIDLRRDDVLLLCSDGLVDMVPDETIRRRMMEEATAEGTCRALVKDALDAGGRDNVTVAVGRVRPAVKPAPGAKPAAAEPASGEGPAAGASPA